MGFLSSNFFLWLLGLVYVGACLWLILVVLLQEGKSGGMASMDSAAQSPEILSGSFGSGGAQKGLFRMTTVTAAVFFVLALTLTILGNFKEMGGGALDLDSESSAIKTLPDTTAPVPALPEIPASTPPAGEAPAPTN
jgi:preprotein translocase subunit SecG